MTSPRTSPHQLASIGEPRAYLARVSDELGVPDPVDERFADAVGNWHELRDAAELWRRTADHLENATQDVSARLGGIDSAWQGADADAFLAHMQSSGLAGRDVVDAIRAFAEVLDGTAEGLRRVAEGLAEVMANTAESVADAMNQPVSGEEQAREHLEALEGPVRDMLSSAEDVLRAFAEFCNGFDSDNAATAGIEHKMPGKNWDFGGAAATSSAAVQDSPAGEASPPDLGDDGVAPVAVAGGAAGAAVAGGGMVGMMPMGMMGGMGGQGPQERQNASRFKSSPEGLFGRPGPASPAVIGEKKAKKSKPDKP